MEQTISIPSRVKRSIPDTRSIPFGVQTTDHMFISEYKNGNWNDPRITPYASLSMSPIALCLHYGQTVFEGMKAFRQSDGKVAIFRPDKHYERFMLSLKRMCMPEIPRYLFIEALHQFVALDSDWIPAGEDGALYLRPFMIATEARLGMKTSDEYLFMIVATPAYQYYTKPLRVKVESQYVRAAEGGTGAAKCGGNYGAALYPTELARQSGFDQVIWTDSYHHEFMEESGTMNVMFVINNILITPPLSGTILDGVTRDSLLTLARDMGIAVEKRKISYREVQKVLENGGKVEAFGAGTAAVVAPIEIIGIGNKEYHCHIGPDALMHKLHRKLVAIRKGQAPDLYNWNYII